MVHCPIFENSTIIQQPADLLTIHQTYVDAATMFIKKKAGKKVYACTRLDILYIYLC